MLRAVLNKSWRQHPTRPQLYGHLPPITKTIQVRRTRHAGHCWRSKDELISDVLLWTPTYGCAKAGRPARTYIQQLCEDTGCNPEDLPEAMNHREKWRERVRDIRAGGMTWWWWWFSNLNPKKSILLLLELSIVTRVLCILRQPVVGTSSKEYGGVVVVDTRKLIFSLRLRFLSEASWKTVHFIAVRGISYLFSTIFFRQHKWMTKLYFNHITRKVFYWQLWIRFAFGAARFMEFRLVSVGDEMA